MKINQAQSELKVFRKFVEAAGLSVLPATMRNVNLRNQTSFAKSVGLGTSRKLVEILDEDCRSRKRTGPRSRSAASCSEYSSVFRKSGSLRKCSRVARFSEKLVLGEEKARNAALFAFLDDLPPGFAGDVMVPTDVKLSGVVKSLRVTRGNYPPGPHFQVEAAQFISNPVVDKLTVKFAKNYSTSHHVQLLAFYELHPAGPELEVWMSAVRDYVNENIGQSPFSRV